MISHASLTCSMQEPNSALAAVYEMYQAAHQLVTYMGADVCPDSGLCNHARSTQCAMQLPANVNSSVQLDCVRYTQTSHVCGLTVALGMTMHQSMLYRDPRSIISTSESLSLVLTWPLGHQQEPHTRAQAHDHHLNLPRQELPACTYTSSSSPSSMLSL